MTLISFFRIIAQKWKWLILFPFLISFTVFFLTRTQEREFETKATIYTGLASGYSITDDGEKKTDLLAINNSFDNLLITIKSRETLEEVGLKLLAQHLLLAQPSADIMGESAFYKFNKLIPEEIR